MYKQYDFFVKHFVTTNSIEIIKQNSSLDVTKDDIEQVLDYYPYGKVLREGMPVDGALLPRQKRINHFVVTKFAEKQMVMG